MSIDVHVRVRPGVENSVWATAETVIHNVINPKLRYMFNKVHPTTATNTNLFRGVEPLVHAAFEGKHVTILAYGQTGSGKTHSMLGVPSDFGIVPRAAKLLLDLVAGHPSASLSIALSVTEIYNDAVRDLLDPNCRELHIKDVVVGGDAVVLTDAKTVAIHSLSDFISLSQQALGNRKTGVTNMNEHSSRSHMILTLEIHRGTRSSSLSLVDLAGSESASRAMTRGVQLQEGGHINQSLLSLGNVVNAIVEGRSHIPYRESKLTRLLKNCLGGTGLTFILCCVNPARDNQDQTNASLTFAQRAMKIKNDPVVVVSMPPLFTHQFARSTSALVENVPELSTLAYQRGLRDAYHHCVDTTGSILMHTNAQVGTALRAMANAQRMLLASDQVSGIDQVRALEAEVVRMRDAVRVLQSQRENESKRLRECDAAVDERRSKLRRLEETLDVTQKRFDVESANHEWELNEAKRHRTTALDVFMTEERAMRGMLSSAYWQGLSDILHLALDEAQLLTRQFDGRFATVVSASFGCTHREFDQPGLPSSPPFVSSLPSSSSSALLPRQARQVYAFCGVPNGLSHEECVQRMSETAAQLQRDIDDLDAAFQMIKDELPCSDEGTDDGSGARSGAWADDAQAVGVFDESHSNGGHVTSADGGQQAERGMQMSGSHLSTDELRTRIAKLASEEHELRQRWAAGVRQETETKLRTMVAATSAQSQPGTSTAATAATTSTPPRRVAAGHTPPPPEAGASSTPASTPTHRSHRLAYVSPYSQRALGGQIPVGQRSPVTPTAQTMRGKSPQFLPAAPQPSPNAASSTVVPPSSLPPSSTSSLVGPAGAKRYAAAEKAVQMGREVRCAMELLRETKSKLLQSSPTASSGPAAGAAVNAVEEPRRPREGGAVPPLHSIPNNSGQLQSPFSTKNLSSQPPSSTSAAVFVADSPQPSFGAENEGAAVVGIAARRKLENQPMRPAAEKTLYYMSFSPQLDVSLGRGGTSSAARSQKKSDSGRKGKSIS